MPNPDNAVQDIKDRLPIEVFIGEYLTLTRAGINFKAPCPFHAEKTPSFMVSPERKSWHCFGCDRGGDIFSFLMEMEGLEFKEALKHLAKKAGVALPQYRGDKERTNKKARLYEINELAAEFYQKKLLEKSEAAKKAQAELIKRKVDDLTRDTFKVGLAPDDWEGLSKLLVKRGYKEIEMVAAGVVIKRQPPKQGVYDRFRNRLMFPLVDVVGRVVGFSGRAMDPEEKMGKYINSPETDIFRKSNYLYALNLAKSEIRKRDFVILVEGQMDVVSSHRVGVKNVIATSGTALTASHLELLKRYTNNLVLAFDVDVAGASATKKGIDLALTTGLNVKIAKMPQGVDPDDLCRTKPKAWGQAINDSEGIIDYYLRQSSEGRDLAKVETKKNIARAVLPEIARLQDEIEQSHYLQKLSTMVNVSEEVLRSAIQKKKSGATNSSNQRQANQQTSQQTKQTATRSPKPLNPLTHRLARLFALKISQTKKSSIDSTLLKSFKIISSTEIKDLIKLLGSDMPGSQIMQKLEVDHSELLTQVNKELFLLDQTSDDVTPADEIKQLLKIVLRDSLKKELTDLHARAVKDGYEGATDSRVTNDIQKEFVQKSQELARLEE